MSVSMCILVLILNLDVSCLYASLTDKLACAMMDIPLLKLEHTDIMGVIESCLKWIFMWLAGQIVILHGSSNLTMLLNICFQLLYFVFSCCSVIVY